MYSYPKKYVNYEGSYLITSENCPKRLEILKLARTVKERIKNLPTNAYIVVEIPVNPTQMEIEQNQINAQLC